MFHCDTLTLVWCSGLWDPFSDPNIIQGLSTVLFKIIHPATLQYMTCPTVLGSNLCGVCMLFSCIWGMRVSSRYSGFLPHSKDMQVRLIARSKLPVGMSVWVNGVWALWWIGNLSRVGCIPVSPPMHAGIGSRRPVNLTRNKQVR